MPRGTKRADNHWRSIVMENFEDLLKISLAEIEKVLSTKTIVGEPINVDGTTIIPLISVGFGFGGGGGAGKSKAPEEGTGNGLGGGGGAKPIAIIIIAKDGSVRVEPVKGSRIAEGLGDLIRKVVEREAKPAA
jgi:uncharacterized spore protein YtfJ